MSYICDKRQKKYITYIEIIIEYSLSFLISGIYFLYVRHIKDTKRSSTHGACCLILQPFFFCVFVLSRSKPFSQTIVTPHWPAKTITTSF